MHNRQNKVPDPSPGFTKSFLSWKTRSIRISVAEGSWFRERGPRVSRSAVKYTSRAFKNYPTQLIPNAIIIKKKYLKEEEKNPAAWQRRGQRWPRPFASRTLLGNLPKQSNKKKFWKSWQPKKEQGLTQRGVKNIKWENQNKCIDFKQELRYIFCGGLTSRTRSLEPRATIFSP